MSIPGGRGSSLTPVDGCQTRGMRPYDGDSHSSRSPHHVPADEMQWGWNELGKQNQHPHGTWPCVAVRNDVLFWARSDAQCVQMRTQH